MSYLQNEKKERNEIKMLVCRINRFILVYLYMINKKITDQLWTLGRKSEYIYYYKSLHGIQEDKFLP